MLGQSDRVLAILGPAYKILMIHRVFLRISALSGLGAIGLGAFGAHGLQARLLMTGMLSAWETAVRYHLIHTVALLVIAVAQAQVSDTQAKWLRRAGLCWTWGIVLFAGSLYWLALGGPRWLGPVTPVGGLAFILGWAMLLPATTKPSS